MGAPEDYRKESAAHPDREFGHDPLPRMKVSRDAHKPDIIQELERRVNELGDKLFPSVSLITQKLEIMGEMMAWGCWLANDLGRAIDEFDRTPQDTREAIAGHRTLLWLRRRLDHWRWLNAGCNARPGPPPGDPPAPNPAGSTPAEAPPP